MEEEKRAITISNSSEGTVEGILEQIKVTYEGERWRAWREVLPVLWEQQKFDEEKESKGEGDAGQCSHGNDNS